MRILKYLILVLMFLNVPSFGVINFGPIVGAFFSTLLYVSITIYFIANKKSNPIIPFAILGLLYFLISSINYTGVLNEFFSNFIKYLILTLFATQLFKETNSNELCFFILIGAVSILINVLVFPDNYGRYSGLYINPNRAGFVCLLGFSLTYKLKNIPYRFIAQFLFIIGGIMTFSRYFILILLFINLISIVSNKKNVIVLFTGLIAILIIISSTSLQFNNDRFNALKSVFSDDVDTETISKNSRDETWAEYTEVLFENPILGNGYRSFHGHEFDTVGVKVGVHNSYLMMLGESGILPFLMLIIIYIALFIRSLNHFKTHPEYTYLAIILMTFLLVSHNFFDNLISLFISLWLYEKVKKDNEIDLLIDTENDK